MYNTINEPIENMGEPLSRTVGSDDLDCVNNQVKNPFETLSDEELVELRSELEMKLYHYEKEKREVELYNTETWIHPKCRCLEGSERSLYDIETDLDYTQYQIEEVDKCLSERNLDWYK